MKNYVHKSPVKAGEITDVEGRTVNVGEKGYLMTDVWIQNQAPVVGAMLVQRDSQLTVMSRNEFASQFMGQPEPVEAMMPNVTMVARMAHEVNRAYCASVGDFSQLPWDEAPDWQRQSAVNGVNFHIANPDADPEASHDSWLAEKKADGWKHGDVKDEVAKTHPCCVPYSELPVQEKSKDFLFRAVVHSMGLPVIDEPVVAKIANDVMSERLAMLENLMDGGVANAMGENSNSYMQGQGNAFILAVHVMTGQLIEESDYPQYPVVSDDNMNARLTQVKGLLETQLLDGNWNFNANACGLANGIELAVAIMEDREPEYITVPVSWKNDSRNIPGELMAAVQELESGEVNVDESDDELRGRVHGLKLAVAIVEGVPVDAKGDWPGAVDQGGAPDEGDEAIDDKSYLNADELTDEDLQLIAEDGCIYETKRDIYLFPDGRKVSSFMVDTAKELRASDG